jgi:hypothetical protein
MGFNPPGGYLLRIVAGSLNDSTIDALYALSDRPAAISLRMLEQRLDGHFCQVNRYVQPSHDQRLGRDRLDLRTKLDRIRAF